MISTLFTSESKGVNGFYKLFAAIACAATLYGCSAALVPYTSDPAKKISYAQQLINEGRGLAAEKLLREVNETTPTDVNGYLLRGSSHFLYLVLIDGKRYCSGCRFEEKVEGTRQDAQTHYELALKDYHTAESLIQNGTDAQAGDPGGKNPALSNIAWREAQLHYRKGEIPLACAAMDESLKYNELAVKEHPSMKFEMNSHFSSYAEMIAANKKFMGCSPSK